MILNKKRSRRHITKRLKPIQEETFKHFFVPLAWQVTPFHDVAPVVLLTGSAGGGKSRLAAEKVHRFCLDYPHSTWLILRKAREWCSRSIIPFFNQTIVNGDPRVTYSKSKGAFFYSNGSVVYSGGMMDAKQRESIRSIGGSGGLDGVWMEEANAFTRQDFEELSGRLRHTAGPYRQIILTTNPGGPRHWIYTGLIKQPDQASVYYSGARDNPNNPPDYLQSLERLTGMMYQRLVLGKWVQAEGVVYDNFEFTTHVKYRSLSEFLGFGLAMDEGYTNPAVILLIGIDSDGRWHICKEFYERGKLQEEVVAYARSWCDEYDVYMCAVDSAAAGLIADLINNGIPAEGGKGRVLDGIRAIQDRLIVQGDSKPRLTISPTCENTVQEFESYAWKPEKDEPIKEFDHALDALRYFHDIQPVISSNVIESVFESAYGQI